MGLTIEKICKTHGRLVVADDIGLTLGRGELGALIGPSGCGKTTLLRMIAGFETPDCGRISIDGTEVFSRKKNVPPEQRRTGMVFQDYALFPHLTVMGNITFGPVEKQKKDLDNIIQMTGLNGSEDKYPHQLSGGQQQRVALARALAHKPELLLMDEPFSNLDIALRESLSEEVRGILREFGTTGLLVTHNQHEAFAMADKVGVIKGGRLLQWDSADALYHRPASVAVAQFVGEGAFLEGWLSPDGTVSTEIGSFNARRDCLSGQKEPVTIFVRPENFMVDPGSPYKARLVKSHFRGPGRFLTFASATGHRFTVLGQCPKPLTLNREYGISICNHHVSVFHGQDGGLCTKNLPHQGCPGPFLAETQG